MPLPRVRFTVRRMMVAVAIVAALLGAYDGIRRLVRRSAGFRAVAQEHAYMESMLRSIMAANGDDSPLDISRGPGEPSRRSSARTVAEGAAALKRKYERAARYPFLPVAPDTPGPE